MDNQICHDAIAIHLTHRMDAHSQTQRRTSSRVVCRTQSNIVSLEFYIIVKFCGVPTNVYLSFGCGYQFRAGLLGCRMCLLFCHFACFLRHKAKRFPYLLHLVLVLLVPLWWHDIWATKWIENKQNTKDKTVTNITFRSGENCTDSTSEKQSGSWRVCLSVCVTRMWYYIQRETKKNKIFFYYIPVPIYFFTMENYRNSNSLDYLLLKKWSD